MSPKEYLHRFAADVSKRSGICQATCEVVAVALFDEIRYRLVQGTWPCVPIESFGTFAIIVKPERTYHNTKNGKDEWRQLAPKKMLKFSPTRNTRREIEAGDFDPTRRSFSRNPKDPPIKTRSHMRYRKRGPVPLDRKQPPTTPVAYIEEIGEEKE